MEFQNNVDYSDLYTGKKLTTNELNLLIDRLNNIHQVPQTKAPTKTSDMARIDRYNAVFEAPLNANNSFKLDKITPGLGQIASEFRSDQSYKNKIKLLGEKFLKNNSTKLHGEFSPSNWYKTAEGPKIADSNVELHGAPEYDWGVFVAHLILTAHSYSYIEQVINNYNNPKDWDQEAAWGFCGVEIMRRILGEDQISLNLSLPRIHDLLELSHELICLRREW